MLGVAVALPVLLLLAWMFRLEVGHESEYAQSIALRIARATATEIESQHELSAALLEQIARRGATCESLADAVVFFPAWSNLFYFDRSGAMVCSARPDNGRAIQRLAERGTVVRRIGDEWMSITEKPLANGTLVLMQELDFSQTEVPLPNAIATIVDRDGMVIARTIGADGIVGRRVENTELAKIAAHGAEGRLEARGFDGVLRQYGFMRIPALQWTVYAGVPATHVLGSEREMYLFGVAGGVSILVVITIAVFLIAREIEKPVSALAGAAESASHVGYGRVDSTGGPAEIARLSAAFNEMMDRRSTAEQNLKALSERLLTVQEQERMRVAREIHDDLGQALTALKMDVIGLVEKTRPSPETRPMIDRILRTLDLTVTSVQRISSELRPSVLDDLGLFAAIESEARVFEERTGIECELSTPDELREVDSTTSAAIYRIFQEALTNVARHSNASRVEIRVRERSGELFLEIRDDGRGIVSEQIDDPASLGLAGIRERADMLGGTALIEGIPGRGTIVSVRIPLGAQA